jgi:deoxyribose-phosphate aldolase
MYTKQQFAKMIDNSLLSPICTKDEVLTLCDESAKRHFAAVCVLPCWVGTAARELNGSDVKVASVIGFPFGATTRLTKVFEIKNAIANGAKEIDAVMNISRFKSGDHSAVAQDLIEMVEATRTSGTMDDSRRIQIKIIIETCFLTDAEKDIASRLVRDAGADFVKTSTGTGSGGATPEDIRQIRRAIGSSAVGIKASGGIKTVQIALQMLDAGANRIGTSSGVALYDAYEPDEISEKRAAAAAV